MKRSNLNSFAYRAVVMLTVLAAFVLTGFDPVPVKHSSAHPLDALLINFLFYVAMSFSISFGLCQIFGCLSPKRRDELLWITGGSILVAFLFGVLSRWF